MLRASLLAFLPCLLVTACFSAPLPDGAGRGVIAYDPDPPAGAKLYPQPTFGVGDRFALLRGGQIRQQLVVVQADARGMVVQDAAGHTLRRTPELGYLGEWDAEGEPVNLRAPVDTRFHWPLWVGKQWRCEYVDRRRGAPLLTVEVTYRVEEVDQITVPAGTFETLRIARTAALKTADGDKYFDRTSLSWYAPSIGLDVRQVLDGTAFELVEWTRAAQQ